MKDKKKPKPWYKKFWKWFWPDKAWELFKIIVPFLIGSAFTLALFNPKIIQGLFGGGFK